MTNFKATTLKIKCNILSYNNIKLVDEISYFKSWVGDADKRIENLPFIIIVMWHDVLGGNEWLLYTQWLDYSLSSEYEPK